MAIYKYSCRKCPIRNRCIKESSHTTSTKNMIRSAFEARTDTLATWGLLQENCLLIIAEEEQERRAQRESSLRRRLREAREARRQAAAEARAKKAGKKSTDPLIRRLPEAEARRKTTEELAEERAAMAKPKESADLPDYLKPVSSSSASSSTDGEMPEVIGTSNADIDSLADIRELAQKPAKPCWFTVRGSGRHIMLPTDGEVVLGRFDAAFGMTGSELRIARYSNRKRQTANTARNKE